MKALKPLSNVRSRKAVTVVAALTAATAWAASPEITVQKGSSQTKTESLSFSKMTLHDDLKAHGTGGDVNNPMTLTPDAGAVIELAPDAGDSAVLKLQGNVRFTGGWNALLRFGAGVGKVVSEVWGNCSTPWPKIEVSAEASGEDDVLRIAELNAGPFNNSSITNKNARPVEILFNGGSLATSVWGGRTLSATELNPIVLRGGDGKDIRLEPGWYPWWLAGDADRSVATTGACDVVIATDSRDAKDWGRIWLDRPLAWGHTGDTVARGVEIRTDKDDVLPYGPGTGGLVLSSTVWQVNNGYPLTAILDLNGTTQTVNSLDVSQNSCATNKAAKTACLRFGAGDADGTLKGVVAANVKVCKIGAGTLTLDGATVTAPDVAGGALAVAGETTVNGFGDLVELTPVLPVKTDDTNYNEQQGGSPKKVMEASGLLTVAPRTVTVNEGGALVYRNEAAEALERFVKLDAKGAFVKKGAGALFVRGSEKCPQSFSGVVRAAEGTLTLSGMGVTNAFWRVTITGMVGKDMKEPTIGEIGLFDADGNRINLKTSGYSWQKDLTDATQLKGEQCMVVPTGLTYATNTDGMRETPNNLFNGTYYNWMQVKSETALESVAITFRLPEAEGRAAAYSYAFTPVGGLPTSWTVETSVDGKNWTLADERTDFYKDRFSWDYSYYYWYLDGRWGGFAGLPFTFAFANEKTDAVTIEGAMLRADAGATLDVSSAAGAPAGIEIDATVPGGTIVGMPSVRNGTLRIVNLPSGQSRADLTKVASLVTCTGALTAEDLATWRVTVNGKATRMGVTMDAEGHVGVTALGLAVIIR